jgi:hypothetical protein
MVIKSHPLLEDGSPFPTLYWLTCPALVKSISALESEGYMDDVNDELRDSPSLRDRLLAALARYRMDRDSLMKLDADPPGGGPDRVKCLHAHTAQELASRPNPIGAISLARAGWPDCRDRCYQTAK